MENGSILSIFLPSVEVSAATMTGTELIRLGDSLPSGYEAQFGRVNIEWGSLDYAMRIACKRIVGVALETDEGKKIMKLWSHKDILKLLKKTAESDTRLNKSAQSELAKLIGRIGTRKDEGHLYDRRNTILHSFWAVSPEGKLVGQRIGTDEWREPIAVTQEELSTLCDEIRDVWQGLLRFTEPLLNRG